jgi:hypothetical protein
VVIHAHSICDGGDITKPMLIDVRHLIALDRRIDEVL